MAKYAKFLGVNIQDELDKFQVERTISLAAYQYLTGPRFRHRVEAIVEKFVEMQSDLDRERKTMTRLWAKREEQMFAKFKSTSRARGS